MKFGINLRALSLMAVAVASLAWVSCGVTAVSFSMCTIDGFVAPTIITVDHLAVAPNNSVQFKLAYTATTYCTPNIVIVGVWSTSDPANVAIDQSGVATCLHATPNPAGIYFTVEPNTYSWTYQAASLSCR